MFEAFGCIVGDADFFLYFAMQGLLDALAQVYVAAYGCVPFAWLYVFPIGAFLKVKVTF